MITLRKGDSTTGFPLKTESLNTLYQELSGRFRHNWAGLRVHQHIDEWNFERDIRNGLKSTNTMK